MKPRATVHHGSVLAAGFWIRGGAGAKQQVLSLWEPGAEVLRVADGHVLLLHGERRFRAELGSPAPLTRQGRWLCSAPLGARQLALLDSAMNLALVTHGELVLLRLEQLERVDPATWLDVSSFVLREVKALVRPRPPRAALSDPADAQAMFDASTGRSPEDRARQSDVLQALAGAQAHGQAPRTGQPGVVTRALVGTLRALDALGARLSRLLGRMLPATSNPARAGEPPLRTLAEPQPPGFWQRVKTTLSGWLLRTQFGAYLGRKHAQYLSDLFDMLERRNDEEVLRRAIPLGKDGQTGPSSPALRSFALRSDFSISLGPRQASSSVGLGGDLYEQLRRAYEAVFRRLDAAGKHEQAAYFLAEILNESERAVSYLEKQGRLELAAQLAEARGLPAGLVVRQWFLAGNSARAILIAVREQAFDDAIQRLISAGQKREAEALRLLQAERLAQAGRLVRAAELAHPLSGGKPLALRWLELAREASDLHGIALELSLDAGRFEVAREALQPLLGGTGPDQLPVLLHLAEAFVRHDVDAARPLARELGRELYAVAASEGSAAIGRAAAKVADYVGGAFKVDRPPLVSFEQRIGATSRRYRYAASDCGTRAVLDVHRSGQNLLLALGEAGVLLWNRHGKRLAHFDVPADALVTSLDGSRALCVARRDNHLAVSRIDVATRRSERWCELEARSFAPLFDGETWFVCSRGELLQLDVLDPGPSVLQRVPMPLEAPRLLLDERQLNVIGSEPFGPPERMRFELGRLTLRERNLLVRWAEPTAGDEPHNVFIGAVLARGDEPALIYNRWSADAAQGKPALLTWRSSEIALPTDDLDGWATLELAGDFYVLQLATEERTRLLLGSRVVSHPYVDVVLEGAQCATVQAHQDLVLIADDVGRVLGIDPVSGRPLFDRRI
jgi:hypothetical protein